MQMQNSEPTIKRMRSAPPAVTDTALIAHSLSHWVIFLSSDPLKSVRVFSKPIRKWANEETDLNCRLTEISLTSKNRMSKKVNA